MMMHGSEKIAPKRRKVRKGTHSCWECKRRKVRCTFSGQDDLVCIPCHRRNKLCVSQEAFEGSEVVENDIASTQQDGGLCRESVNSDVSSAQPGQRYDGAILDLSTCKSILPPSAMTVHSTALDHGTNHESCQRMEEFASPSKNPAPASALPSVYVSDSVLEKRCKITQALLSVLPAHKDIEILQNKVSRISLLCYQSNYKCKGVLQTELPKEQIPLRNLLHPENHPVLLARQMLLFAAALQHIPPKEVINGLTEHHQAIMERLAESAIQLVTTNDTLLGTLEGLENIVLEIYYHIDGGNIRRAWITIRRAVMAAQLMGLHKPGQNRHKVINEKSDIDPDVQWGCISSMETVLSLLLGLPTSIPNTRRPDKVQADISGQIGRSPPVHFEDMAARILERNEILTPQLALDLTREIDREFIKMAKQIPSTLWGPSDFSGLGLDSELAFWEIRRTWDLMCYYTLLNQLHLPYMLRSTHTPQGNYSRLTCVNASREILSREIAMRTFNSITACCRMSTFMALIAGMTLMLAHIVSHCQRDTDNPIIHQRPGDIAIVVRALECMKTMSEIREDMLSAKCATLLSHLLEVEADAAQGQSYNAQKLAWTKENCEDDENVLIIKVPYVGVFRFAPESTKHRPSPRTELERGNHEEVTLGGMGSLHVNISKLPEQDRSEPPTKTATSQAVNSPLIRATSSHDLATHLSSATSEHFSVQHDPMFPDAAASMSDWVFQGFDTAFFDTLMRSTNDDPLDGASADLWEFQTFD